MTDMRLDFLAAERIAAGHDSACSAIDDCADRAASSPDGGEATPYLLEILAAVTGTAGELALLNQAVAQQVREAAASYGSAEDVVGERFATIDEVLR